MLEKLSIPCQLLPAVGGQLLLASFFFIYIYIKIIHEVVILSDVRSPFQTMLEFGKLLEYDNTVNPPNKKRVRDQIFCS